MSVTNQRSVLHFVTIQFKYHRKQRDIITAFRYAKLGVNCYLTTFGLKYSLHGKTIYYVPYHMTTSSSIDVNVTKPIGIKCQYGNIG